MVLLFAIRKPLQEEGGRVKKTSKICSSNTEHDKDLIVNGSDPLFGVHKK